MVKQFSQLARVGKPMTDGAKINASIDGIYDKHLLVLKKVIWQDLIFSYWDVLTKLHAKELNLVIIQSFGSPFS